MKNLLLSTFTFLILTVQAMAQGLPNGGFETWNTTPYVEPTGWYTGNLHSIHKMGFVPVTRVAGQSGFALRIETSIANGDTSDSYISNSAMGDPTQGQGGVPYSQQPTALTGYYRYNLPGNDSAGILIVFKKNSAIISTHLFMIKGTGNQSTFLSFSFPMSVPSVPDTVIMAAVSSNLLTGVGIANGSFLELDELAFAGTSQIIPNGDFESWTPQAYETPVGWTAMGDSVYKTTDHFAGTYAVALKTSLAPDGRVNPSGITTGKDQQNGIKGGLPYTLMADTLIGYYKYIAVGTDTANGFINLSSNGNPIGGNGFYLHPASGYTYFQIPFSSFSPPDTMLVVFVSSSFNSPVPGSTLYLDGLTLKSVLTGMSEVSGAADKMLTYPNPASDVLNIETGNRAASLLIRVYDMAGRMVKESIMIIRGSAQLNVSDLPKGIYTVEVRNGEELFRSRFVKE